MSRANKRKRAQELEEELARIRRELEMETDDEEETMSYYERDPNPLVYPTTFHLPEDDKRVPKKNKVFAQGSSSRNTASSRAIDVFAPVRATRNETEAQSERRLERIENLVLRMYDLYTENQNQIARNRRLRINEASDRPNIDTGNLRFPRFRYVREGENMPNHHIYNIGLQEPLAFTLDELMFVISRMGNEYNEDLFRIFHYSSFLNIDFQDPNNGLQNYYYFGRLDALQKAEYDQEELPDIFRSPIIIGPSAQFSISNIGHPLVQSNRTGKRDKYAAGTTVLHPSIKSNNFFIPNSNDFCIEEVYNHINNCAPYGFVRKCVQKWGKNFYIKNYEPENKMEYESEPEDNNEYDDVIEDEEQNEGDYFNPNPKAYVLATIENVEEMLSQNIKPKLCSFDPFHPKELKNKATRDNYMKSKSQPIILYHNNTPSFNVAKLGPLFGNQVHYYDPFNEKVMETPRSKKESRFRSGEWVLVFFYIVEENKNAKIIFRTPCISEESEDLSEMTRIKDDIFHKNILHCAAFRWREPEQNFKQQVIYAFNNQEEFITGNFMPDVIEQVECTRIQNSARQPHHSFIKNKEHWTIDYGYDIETTQIAADQKLLNEQVNINAPVYPYALAAKRIFIDWDAEDVGDFNKSIWNKEKVFKYFNQEWETALNDKDLLPENGYIEEYINELDYLDSGSAPTTRFLAKICFDTVLTAYHAKKDANNPQSINVNLFAYNGSKFDHKILLQDNFWALQMSFKESISENIEVSNWQSSKIIGSWSNIKFCRMRCNVNIEGWSFPLCINFDDPLNYIAPKCSLDEFTKTKLPSHRYRKRGLDHSEINLENVLEKKRDILYYLKFDIYLCCLATISVMESMIIMMNEASKSCYPEHMKMWCKSNFRVFEKRLDPPKTCHNLPKGLSKHSLCIANPLMFMTAPSTARRFLKWNNVGCMMAISPSIRKYISQSKVGGRTQVIRTKYKNQEFKKLEKNLEQYYYPRCFDDLQYNMYRRAIKNVTGCVYDDSLVSLKNTEGKMFTKSFEKPERTCFCGESHCLKCLHFIRDIILPQKVKIENTSWSIPKEMKEYFNKDMKTSDILPEHFNIPTRTKLHDININGIHLAGTNDEPLINYDANSLYPSAYVLHAINNGEIIPWHTYEKKLLSPSDFEKEKLFGIVTYDIVYPPERHNAMPFIKVICNEKELNILDPERSKNMKENLPFQSSSSHLWMENEIENFTIDTITAREMEKVGWKLGKIKHGLIFTNPINTIGQIQLDLYNLRKKYKKEFGSGSCEEVSIKLAMNSIYGMTLMKDFIGMLVLASIFDKKANRPHKFVIKDEEIEINSMMRSWKHYPFDFWVDDIQKTGMPHQMGVQLLANSKRIMNIPVNALNPKKPNVYYTDTDSIYVSGKWSRKLQCTYIPVFEKRIDEVPKLVPVEGKNYLGQLKNDYGTGSMIYHFQSLAPKIKISEIISNNGHMDLKVTFKGGVFSKDVKNLKKKYSWNLDMENLSDKTFELLFKGFTEDKQKIIEEKDGIVFVPYSPRYEMNLRKVMVGKIEDMKAGKNISFSSKLCFKVPWSSSHLRYDGETVKYISTEDYQNLRTQIINMDPEAITMSWIKQKTEELKIYPFEFVFNEVDKIKNSTKNIDKKKRIYQVSTALEVSILKREFNIKKYSKKFKASGWKDCEGCMYKNIMEPLRFKRTREEDAVEDKDFKSIKLDIVYSEQKTGII